MGEPRPVLSEDARERVVAALRAGSDEARAIRFAKVDPALYYSWLERGEADLERGAFTEQAQFARDVQQAKSESAVTAMAAVRAAMREDWRAAAWYLENVGRSASRDVELERLKELTTDAAWTQQLPEEVDGERPEAEIEQGEDN
jgi:hypothetical protein